MQETETNPSTNPSQQPDDQQLMAQAVSYFAARRAASADAPIVAKDEPLAHVDDVMPAGEVLTDSEEQPVASPRRSRAAWVVAGLIVLLGLGVGSFFAIKSVGVGDAVAVVRGEKVSQSDVDVQVNLRKSLQEVGLYPRQKIDPNDVLAEIVQQRLVMQDARANNFAIPDDAAVTSFLTNTLKQVNADETKVYEAMTRYGLGRSLLLDTIRNKIVIDEYLQEVIWKGAADDTERQQRTNEWRSKLIAEANISYPQPLRDDTGPAARVGRIAPELAGTDLDGQPFQLTALKGKPTVITFWATWCQYCRRFMPKLDAAYQQHKAAGLQVLACNTGDTASVAEVEAYRQTLKLTFPILVDSDQTIGETFNVQSFPMTFFVDKEGRIAYIQYGEMTNEAFEQNVALIMK